MFKLTPMELLGIGASLPLALLLVLGFVYYRTRRRIARLGRDNTDVRNEVARLRTVEAQLRLKTSSLQKTEVELRKDIERLRQESTRLSVEASQRRAYAESRRQQEEENDLSNTANQLRFIGECKLSAVRPVNQEASTVFYALKDWIGSREPKWHLSVEVAMGAFIKTNWNAPDTQKSNAFRSYNSKRVDFLLVDNTGYPRLVVEYNGTGHALSEDADGRMAVKRLALERAGIPLLEIPAHSGKEEIWAWVSSSIKAPASAGVSH